MNMKLMLISILSVFTLISISFASAINTNTANSNGKKESPLFGIRTRKAIREKIGDMLRRFVGERVFFLPFQWLKKLVDTEEQIPYFTQKYCPTASFYPSCCKC